MVFRVKSSRGRRLALKRMAVNNDNDLYLARQEIAIMVRSNSNYIEGSLLPRPIHSFSIFLFVCFFFFVKVEREGLETRLLRGVFG